MKRKRGSTQAIWKKLSSPEKGIKVVLKQIMDQIR
jgi:hypothetical protein